MDKIRKGGYFLFFCSGFLMGGIIGVIFLNLLISYRVDQYHQKIKTLEVAIEDKDTRLDKLQETINKRKLLVKSIEVNLDYRGDELERITLQKYIKEKFTKVIGKEVDLVDADMFWDVVDSRIMKIKDKEYSLKVSKLIISETIRIWIQVK